VITVWLHDKLNKVKNKEFLGKIENWQYVDTCLEDISEQELCFNDLLLSTLPP
jgi:hypothetical protein